MGDSHVYVDGNKIEEVNGDLVQIVHGNHYIGVGGQMNLNASEEIQMRGAQLRLESNVAGINLKAAKGLFAETGESMHFKSGIAIFQEATNSFNMKAGDNIYIQAGEKGHIKAKEVNIDEYVYMASDRSQPATGSDPSKSTELPEPPPKSTSTARTRNRPNVSTSGAASVDDSTEGGSTSGSEAALGGNTQQTNFIASNLEGKAGAEEYLGRTMSDEEYSALVAAVFAESGRNQTEQAWIAATILNRARSTNSTIIDVLNAPGQFTAVTGTSVNPKPSYWYANGPDKAIEQSINGSLKGILYTIPKNNYYFNAASQSAVQAGERYVTERSGVQATLVGQSFVYPGARWP
jgi:spore germination cell wall hydrolase CwlJ-like protein